MNPDDLGPMIRRAIHVSGLTRREVGERMGISEARVGQLCIARNVSVSTLRRLAEATGTTLRIELAR